MGKKQPKVTKKLVLCDPTQGLRERIKSSKNRYEKMKIELKKRGRRELQDFQRIRASKLNDQNLFYSSFCYCLVQSSLITYAKLWVGENQDEGEELLSKKPSPSEISSFIMGGQRYFLILLSIMINDNHPSIQDAVKIKFQQKSLTQIVPRTFLSILFKLSKRQDLTDQNEWFYLNELQIKSIYIILILFQGIDDINDQICQIDIFNLPQDGSEAIQTLFEKIVGILVSQTNLLTQNVFDYLVVNWGIIFGLVEREIFNLKDKEIDQKTKLNTTKSFQTSTAQRINKSPKIQISKNQTKKITSQEWEKTEQRLSMKINNDGFDFENDHFEMFFTNEYDYESLVNELPQEKIETTPAMQRQNKISKLKAQKQFLYKKKKRIRKSNGTKQIKPKVTMDLGNNNQIFVLEARMYDESSQSNQENLDISQNASLRQQNSSPRPYHNVPHKYREIDTIIDQMVNNDEAIAKYIANHIYYTMITCKIGVLHSP